MVNFTKEGPQRLRVAVDVWEMIAVEEDTPDGTVIYLAGTFFRVKESYEEVFAAITDAWAEAVEAESP